MLIGKDQNLVGAVREATIDTMNAIAEPQLIQAENEVTNAGTQLQQAQTKIFNFDNQYGNASPIVSYNLMAGTLSQDNAQLQTARLNKDAARVAVLTALIATNTSTLATLGREIAASDRSHLRSQRLNRRAITQQQALVAAQSLITTNSAPGTVTTRTSAAFRSSAT